MPVNRVRVGDLRVARNARAGTDEAGVAVGDIGTIGQGRLVVIRHNPGTAGYEQHRKNTSDPNSKNTHTYRIAALVHSRYFERTRSPVKVDIGCPTTIVSDTLGATLPPGMAWHGMAWNGMEYRY